jgi:hypothetical protein
MLQQPLGRLDAPLHATIIGNGQLWSKNPRLAGAWAKSTFDTSISAIKPYFEFCMGQDLAATAATVARYIAWIGERGIIKATSLQPYLSTLNGFFRDHGHEPVAQGNLVGKVKRGLATSHVSLHPRLARMYLPARILVSSLRLAKDMRTQLTDSWTQSQSDTIILFRAYVATVIMLTFFSRGGARVE